MTAVLAETLTLHPSMQSGMAQRDKTTSVPPPLSFAPLGQAVLESFGEGVVVFDAYGRMIYANQSEEHTSELQSQSNLVCRLLLEKKKKKQDKRTTTSIHTPMTTTAAICT